jgi:hypothetical protein
MLELANNQARLLIREDGTIGVTSRPQAATGTALCSIIHVGFSALVDVFGEPTMWGDGDKSDAEWVLMTPYGPVCIYNYKNGPAYTGHGWVHHITEWHIGGPVVWHPGNSQLQFGTSGVMDTSGYVRKALEVHGWKVD